MKTKSNDSIKHGVSALNQMWSTPSKYLAEALFGGIDIGELNHLLFRCDNEEKDISGG